MRLRKLAPALLLPWLLCPLASWAAIQFSPQTPTPQSSLRIASDTPRGGTYFFSLRVAGGGNVAQTTALTPDANGWLQTELPLGAIAAGNYNLVLSEGSASGGNVDSTPITIRAALDVRVAPSSARPGDSVMVELRELVPAPVSLFLDGQRLLGPVNLPAQDGVHRANVAIPANIAIGERSLSAEQTLGTQRIAWGETSLRVLGAGFSGPIRVLNLSPLPAQLTPGEAFEISGQLELRSGSPAGLRARLRHRRPDGGVVLLDDGLSTVEPNGSFTIRGWARAPWAGGHFVFQDGGQGQTDLLFIEPEQGGGGRGSFSYPLGPQSYPNNLSTVSVTVRLRDAQGQPIQGAVVTIDGIGQIQQDTEGSAAALTALRTPSGLGSTARSQARMLLTPNTQFTGLLADVLPQLQHLIQAECPITLWRGESNAQGEVVIELTDFDLMLAEALHLGHQAADGNLSGPGDNLPLLSLVLLRISALPSGFTAGTQPHIAHGIEYPLMYRHAEDDFCGGAESEFFDCARLLGHDPVLNYEFIPYTGTINLPLDPNIGALARSEDDRWPALWGPMTTFPGSSYNDVSGLNIAGNLPIRFTLDQNLFGIVGSAQLFRVNGSQESWIADFPVRPDQACARPGDTEYEYLMPTMHRAPHGEERYRIKVQGQTATRQGQYTFDLKTQAAPEWWRNPPSTVQNRSVEWSPALTRLYMTQRPAPTAVSANPGYGMGSLQNRSDGEDQLSSVIGANGLGSFHRRSDSDNEVVNEGATPSTETSSGVSVDYTWGPERILDTGYFPVFRYAWGLPPIASATFGMDARFWADLMIEVQSELDLYSGQLQSLLRTTPAVGGAIKAFINVSAILGLVDLTASFEPTFGVAMPITLRQGEKITAESEPCFNFKLWIEYVVSVGICPTCIEADDRVAAIDETEPNGCTVPGLTSRSRDSRTLADLGILRTAPVSPAFDNLGQGALASLNTNGRIEVRPWTGSQFGNAIDLGEAPGASEVVQVFHAPGRAIMAYAQSELSSAQFLQSDVVTGARSRALRYRVLQNGVWSAAQPLTSNTGGEAQLALAACPHGESGCPAGGAVMAVWTRDAGSNVFGYAFEIWHAFWQNGSWSTPARLTDAGSGTDMHPQAVYLNGVPLVTFTRSEQRSVGAQETRRLMYLRAGGSPQEVGNAPAGVIWQNLQRDHQHRAVLAWTAVPPNAPAVSNQAELWSARGTCQALTCDFVTQAQTDSFGRRIRAESPRLSRNAQGGVAIAFRGLGFSPNAQGQRVMPGDSLGMVAGSGELMSLSPRFDALPSNPIALSDDGQLYFNPVNVMHPLSGAMLVFADAASLPVLQLEDVQKTLRYRLPDQGLKGEPLDSSLLQFTLDTDLDFSIVELLPVGTRLIPGDTFELDVVVRRNGADWVYDGVHPLEIEAAWRATPGVGERAGSASLNSLDSSGMQTVRLALAVPADIDPADRLALHVSLNRAGDIREANTLNNLAWIELGGLQPPEDLRSLLRAGDRHVVLQWQAASDPQVSSYEVERARLMDDGTRSDWSLVGGSQTNGFIDLTTLSGATYAYRVRGISENGLVSPPSRETIAKQDIRVPLGLFRDGFDGDDTWLPLDPEQP